MIFVGVWSPTTASCSSQKSFHTAYHYDWIAFISLTWSITPMAIWIKKRSNRKALLH
jgi:hypothetical protein